MPNQVKSVMQMPSLYVSNIVFSRKLLITDPILQYNFDRDIDDTDSKNNIYKVALAASVKNQDDSLILKITVVANFTFSEDTDEETKKVLLSRNSTAILFPFLRSQVSLVTTQPGMSPIIIPILNINALFEENKGNDDEILNEE